MAKPKPDFAPVFAALRAILEKYAPKMTVSDTGDYYCLVGAKPGPRGKPVWFAGVRLGKRYVSFHLMPVYCNAALLKGVSAELMKCMQGKACFNFKDVDPALFKSLARLTKAGYECFKKLGWV
jgi:hypothetical protein